MNLELQMSTKSKQGEMKEKFGKKLLVEGKDDQHVIWALCEKFKVVESFDVVDCEGIDKLLAQIPVRLKESGLTGLGIIIDADAEINNRWNSLSSMLSAQGFNIPAELTGDGFITKNEGVVIGVWIMPNNNLNGMLEDFIAFLVPENDKLLAIAGNTLQNIEHQNLDKYLPVHKSKALIHSWLAWQQDPGTPMGLAITKKYLTTDVETCKHLINWINNTFN